jgi:hypothetical protein
VLREVSSSGAPKNIDGMKSKKVCVIAIATMKIKSGISGRVEIAVMEIAKMAMRLMWIPGIIPVIVPARMPRNRASINCSIVVISESGY